MLNPRMISFLCALFRGNNICLPAPLNTTSCGFTKVCWTFFGQKHYLWIKPGLPFTSISSLCAKLNPTTLKIHIYSKTRKCAFKGITLKKLQLLMVFFTTLHNVF